MAPKKISAKSASGVEISGISGKYWVYTLEGNNWDEYKEYLENNSKIYLGLDKNEDISVNDYILIFRKTSIKTKENEGFIGCAQVASKGKINKYDSSDSVRIFKNYNNAKVIYLLNYINYGYLVKLADIGSMLEKINNYKNTTSFKKRYIGNNVEIKLLSFELGEVLYKTIDSMIDQLDLEAKLEKQKEKEEESDNEFSVISGDEDSSDYSISDYDDEEEDERETENSSDVRQFSDDYDIYNPEKEDDDEDHVMGSIPVLIFTCKSFNPPDVEYDTEDYDEFDNPDLEAKKKYIWNHILDCNKCKYINNNNYEVLQRVVRKKSLLTIECCLTDNEVLYECKEKYYSRKKYDPIGTLSKKESEAKLLYINDKYDDYNKCVFLICVGIE